MLNRILATAIVAGVLAGVFVFSAHMVKVVPLIQAAEVFENAGPAEPNIEHSVKEHAHDQTQRATVADHHHSHDGSEWGPEDGLERTLYTLLTDLIMGVGLGLMLTSIIAISKREVDWQAGMLWGLSGFCAVTALPALGLAPEMPGMQAAALADRHSWWGATILASSAGLGLMFLCQRWALKFVGCILIVIPHIVGAPHVPIEAGIIPAEMGSQYAATTLIITLFFWITLGGLVGYFYQRFGRD